MEKHAYTVCPVCSLYLREGITLKTHLQTHSKEKVIEALLNKQDPFLSRTDVDNTGLSETTTEDTDPVTIRKTSGVPSTSYLQPPNQLNSSIHSLYDNQSFPSLESIQYSNNANTMISQTSVGNVCNNSATYQIFTSNEGNIVLIPMYNLCQPSVVVSSNVVTPVVNSCLVVPSSDSVEQISVISRANDNSESIQTTSHPQFSECVNMVKPSMDNTANSDVESHYESSSNHFNDDDRATDDEVANIFSKDTMKGSSNISDNNSSAFERNEDDRDGTLEYRVVSSAQSTPICKRNDIGNVMCNHEDVAGSSKFTSPVPSTDVTDSVQSANLLQRMEYSGSTVNLSNKNHSEGASSLNFMEQSNSVISRKEEEYYILPNDEIPQRCSIPSNSEFIFQGISKSLFTSTSLISSINKTVFKDVKMFKEGEQNDLEHKRITSYIAMSSDTEKERKDSYTHVRDNALFSYNSRNSPFNIQTDESMPARGELSGQESLCSTENSIWEVQVSQNSIVEASDIKIGLHSIMTELSFKPDIKISSPGRSNSMTEEDKTLVQTVIKKKIVREFHCFYCKNTFDSWKHRQSHIEQKHEDEDSPTIETLFGKKMKYKIETAVKNEDGCGEMEVDSVICRLCSASFKVSLLLLKHLKETHGIRKRTCICPTCFVRFENVTEYQEHIKKVHPYECMTCGKKFHTRPGYMLHQKRHMKLKPYLCDVCDKAFITKQKLTEHVNIHTGNNPIKCEMCDSNFKRYSNYQQHKKYIHLNCKRKLKDFICECGTVFHSKVKLIWHREIHDEKPKPCPFCAERFIHKASLTRHVRKWHNEIYVSEWMDKKKKNVTCPVCNVQYLHTSLRTHMKIHEGVKPYECSECSKSFRTKWNLQLHRWTHMSRGSKPYKCKICVKAYIHKTDYDAHIRSHNNNRPYSCNVCGRQFIRKYNCIRHMREHVEPRSHKCSVCGKLFSRSYYLTEHKKVHTGEKPHICHFCGKTSATKSNHNKHVKMHTGVRESINMER